MACGLSYDLECPVCHENLEEPKILPCCHMACKRCLLSWLTKVGATGGCPLCRAPIITSTGDINSELDALTTNLVAVSLLESQQILQSHHLCSSCDSDASLFCMECSIKLCADCFKFHKRFPATKGHTAEELEKLNVQQLANKNRLTCKLHPDRTAELYCSTHQELICLLCASTRHEVCSGKKMIDDVVETKRQELKLRASVLRQNENRITNEIQDAKEMFSKMRQTVKEMFDDLHKSLDKRQQALQMEIAQHEETASTAIKAMEMSRVAVTSNAAIVESLVQRASGSALLGMVGGLTARMDALDRQTFTEEMLIEKRIVEFNPKTLGDLQIKLASFGQVILSNRKLPETYEIEQCYEKKCSELQIMYPVEENLKVSAKDQEEWIAFSYNSDAGNFQQNKKK